MTDGEEAILTGYCERGVYLWREVKVGSNIPLKEMTCNPTWSGSKRGEQGIGSNMEC